MSASHDNREECIKTVSSEADFRQVHKDLDSYVALATSLKGFKITPKFSLLTSGRRGSLTRNKKMCDMINRKIPGFCDEKFHNYEFALGLNDYSIYVLVRYQQFIENQQGAYDSIGERYMRWICEAFQSLPRISWSYRHNRPVDEPNTALKIRLYNEDWTQFVDKLEEIIQTEMGDEQVHFLYYICRHGLKENIDDMVEEITRRINFNFEEKLVLFQVHIGLEFVPPPSSAVFADLNKVSNLGTFINKYKLCFQHLDGNYGYFSNMASIFHCEQITYFVLYNGLYHQKRFDNSYTLTASSLMGNATAFTKIDKLAKTLPDKCKQKLDDLDGYVGNIREFMPARAEAVMTCWNFRDINAEKINDKLDEILSILLQREILVIARGNLFTEYVSKITDLFTLVIMSFTEMVKPATKQTLSFLHYAENELIWSIERSFQFCNKSRLCYDQTPQSLIIDYLVEDDLKHSTFPYAFMPSVILRIYRYLPQTSWKEFPLAINSNGSINKEYVVLRIYTAYSLETGGIKELGLKRGITKYCPLRCLKQRYISKQKLKAHFHDKVTISKAAECIIHPKTVVGAMITSFVYTEDELDPKKAGKVTQRRMYQYMLKNKIEAFPTKLIEGSKFQGDHRSWSKLIPPEDIINCISPTNKTTHQINNLDASIRRQMNLPQYKKRLGHNPFAKLNEERKRNSQASKQNEDKLKKHSSEGELSVRYEENMSVDGDESAAEAAACEEPLQCDHDEELNSSSSFDIEQFVREGC